MIAPLPLYALHSPPGNIASFSLLFFLPHFSISFVVGGKKQARNEEEEENGEIHARLTEPEPEIDGRGHKSRKDGDR